MTIRRRVIRAIALMAVVGLSAALPSSAVAQTTIDLVEELSTTLTAAIGEDAIGWDELPESSSSNDEPGDLFLLEGGTPSYRPPSADLVQQSQFGTMFSDEAFRALFGKDGALGCEAPSISCATYGSRAKGFADGAIVVGFQLAGPADVSGTEALTIAVLASDDEFPTAQDPRPSSPFVDTNRAWRLDLSAGAATVSYLQIVSGPYQEFRTDARVLLAGDVGWFFIPLSEFPLTSTITGFDMHTFAVPAPDAPSNRQAADTVGGVDPRTLAAPVGVTALLAFTPESVVTPSASPSATSSASPSVSPAPGGNQASSDEGSGPTLLIVMAIVAAILIYLGAALLFGIWPFPKNEVPIGMPPTVVKEKRIRRVRRQVEHTGTETLVETVAEEYEVEVPVVVAPPTGPKEVAPSEPPEPPEVPPGADVTDILEATPGPGAVTGAGVGAAVTGSVPPETPCLEEYRRWKEAEAMCTAARQAAERAEAAAEEARAELERLRSEFPPLGFDRSDEPVIEMDDGSHMSDLDVALLGWDRANRPQPPRATDPRERLEQSKEQLRRLRDELARMRSKEAELIAEVAEAEAAAQEARAHADAVCSQAAEAKAAWERCAGISAGGVVAPPGEGGEPKPDEPERQGSPPGPEHPEPGPSQQPESPEKPEPPMPERPREPEPPKPAPPNTGGGGRGGGGETPSGGCTEGDTRETDVTMLVLEVPRRGGRATITITDETGGAVEFEGHPAQVFLDAAAWARPLPATARAGSSLYRLDVVIQMERISARCYRVERCIGGRWVSMSGRTREVDDPEPFEKKLAHVEELDGEKLRRGLNRARSTFLVADASREKLDTFCQ